jgi:hypothetical protein
MIVVMAMHLKYQIPLWRIRRQLYDALGKKEFRAMMVGRLVEFKMLETPETIYSESDTPEILAIKRAYVSEFKVVRLSGSKIAKVFFGGFALTIIVGVIEYILEGKP